MTLDYKILWIDDHEDFFRNHEDFIKEHIEEKGFEAQIIKHKSLQDYLENDDNKVEQIKYDLFLVDLNLDNGHTGNEIIEKIRSNKVLTDIIFYSTNLADVRRSVNDNNIEGVFVTSRNQNDFEEKVTDVIDVTIKKVQDVNNLRGLIMAEVAELDRIKKRIIQKFSKDADAEFKKYIKEDVFSKIKQELEALQCLVKVEDSECSHDEIDLEKLQKNFFYDSFKKSRTVFKVKNINAKCKEIPFVHQEYYDNVIKKRNVFAHEEENSRVDGTKYLNYSNGTPLEFNEEHCIQIRKDIKKYKELLRDIEQKLDE